MTDWKTEFCKCKNVSALTVEDGELGYWDICCTCGLPIKGGYHYYNHYDGEDHCDIDEL